ncbi:MAG: nucleotide exchange factor GrpE [Erysipelotrichales bacterium]|nr:nucleotide exchange factor GrpE [Erysipelotrichales bacterium]
MKENMKHNCETEEHCKDCQETKEPAPKAKKSESTKEKIARLEEEVRTLSDKLLRNSAELANFKKRTQEEKIQDIKYASSYLISDLLPGLTQLEVVCNMPTDNEMLKNFLMGFKMVNDQIFAVLKQDGLAEIKAEGNFDPKYHQAAEKQKVDGVEPNMIIKEIQKGFTYKERIIKPSIVIISE